MSKFTDVEAGFAVHLREHTKEVHRAAERAGFVAALLRGRATRDGYALFLRNLHPAYAAMEPALASWADHPIVGPFADVRLRRSASLEADLRALSGTEWTDLPVFAEAQAYADAIAAGAADPARLAAHAYARYLGDLSGGQFLKPLLARTLALGDDALGFYDFLAFDDLSAPKRAMRTALDGVPAGGEMALAICEEACSAFRHNIAVSEAVQAGLGDLGA